MRVLLVEDDSVFLDYLTTSLQRAGVETDSAVDVAGAQHALRSQPAGTFDVILLDVELPDRPGWEFLEELRGQGNEIPVIFVTGRGAVAEKVRGLRLGADDYLVKPFEVDELLARLDVVLRRHQEPPPLEFGEVRLDLARRQVLRSGAPVDVTPREFDLLLTLVRARGEPVPRHELIRAVWGETPRSGTNVLDVHIGRLRRKLERKGRPLIRNERGRGYRIVARLTADR